MDQIFIILGIAAIAFLAIVAMLAPLLIFKQINRLEESIKKARAGQEVPISEHFFFFRPIAREISRLANSLTQARAEARAEARLRLEKAEATWTPGRLREFVENRLKRRPVYVISQREPYVHSDAQDAKKYSVPASGLVTALEPVMEACGGTWIAHGSGAADRQVSDGRDRERVPPGEPTYTLRRVWINDADMDGFYKGFSNEALWPLCHYAHQRPIFRAADFEAYTRVNGAFAEAVLDEIRDVERPVIFIQDFHLALVPRMLKNARPDSDIGIFWHIPWPSAEQFSICPWRAEILDGMLGADLIGFHTQQHCNNFLDTVSKEIEALIDLEHFTIRRAAHESHVHALPISISFTAGEDAPPTSGGSPFAQFGVNTEYVGLGVERLDYTKGILERFKGIEFFLQGHPEMKERFTFVQIGSPSRESVPKYREYAEAVEEEVERVNAAFGTATWKPIVFIHRHFSHERLRPLYASANFCLVTSLSDGMNLVAKEYVAARDDGAGVLILSKFTGASRDLEEALIINPYSAEDTAAAIGKALEMPRSEQYRRIKAMRRTVRDHNVYRWAAEFLTLLIAP